MSLTLFQTSTSNSLTIRWSRIASTVCVQGYIIRAQEDSKDKKTVEFMAQANAENFVIAPLKPCRQYVITMQAFLGRFDESRKPIFASKFSEPLIVHTKPDPSSGFAKKF